MEMRTDPKDPNSDDDSTRDKNDLNPTGKENENFNIHHRPISSWCGKMKNHIPIYLIAGLIIVSGLAAYFYEQARSDESGGGSSYSEHPIRIQSGDYFYLQDQSGKLVPMPQPDIGLSEKIKKAINRVPTWLRANLTLQFERLSSLSLELGSCAAPTFADLDGDGDLDMFVGRADARNGYTGPGEEGVFIYYENVGTPENPVFVHRSGVFPHYVAVGSYGSPAFADLDGDGDLDLIAGDDDGDLAYFENIGTPTHPEWADKNNAMFKDVHVGGFSTPAFADLDGDGDLDLTIGQEDGTLSYFRNTGSATSPQWTEDSLMYTQVRVEQYSSPAFGDLNGDGRLDLIVGDGQGEFAYYRNTAGALGEVLWVQDEIPVARMDVGERSHPTIVDLNGDGRLDLIAGAGNGNAYYFENRGTSSVPQFISWNSGAIYDENMPVEITHPLEKNVLHIDRELRVRNEIFADMYADLLLNAEKKYTDEIGFSIAHTPVETLWEIVKNEENGTLREPTILLENAEDIYRADKELDYIKIEDEKVYYRDNSSKWQRMPDLTYYWFIVEPRILFETPRYIHGDYWRTYFMHDTQYNNRTGGTLLEKAKSAHTLYEAALNTASWLASFMEFNYKDNYLQPIIIYDNHEGSCGEWSIITAAAARTVLIPTWVVTNMGEDHQWNEFWYGGWHHWDTTMIIGQPENASKAIDHAGDYENKWHKDISGVYGWRGDDYSWGVSEHYTPVAHLKFVVKDRNGRPVDGARVVVSSHYFMEKNPTYIPVPVPTLWNYTNADGIAYLDVGKNNYTLDVMSKIGNMQMELRDQNGGKIQEGKDYTFNVIIDGAMPHLKGSEVQGEARDTFRVSFEVQGGVARVPSTRSGNLHERWTMSHIDVFVVDEDNFKLFLANEHFQARMLQKGVRDGKLEVQMNEGDYLVFANRDTIEIARVVQVE